MWRNGTVYAILDPLSDAPVYVGQTVNALSIRLGAHLSAARGRSRAPLSIWMRSLGQPPKIWPLYVACPSHLLTEFETKAIAELRRGGASLLNVKDPDAPPVETRKRARRKHSLVRLGREARAHA